MDGDPAVGEKVRANVPKGFLVGLRSQILRAHETAPAIIKEHTALRSYHAAVITGQLRYHIIEDAFARHGENMGGENLFRRELPGYPDSVVFQPLQQFGDVIIAYATNVARGALPSKNLTRSRAVQLNLPFDSRLDLGAKAPSENLLFVCLLVARDANDPTQVSSIELGVIDPKFERFLYREALDVFLGSYEPAPASAPKPRLVKPRRVPRKKTGE